MASAFRAAGESLGLLRFVSVGRKTSVWAATAAETGLERFAVIGDNGSGLAMGLLNAALISRALAIRSPRMVLSRSDAARLSNESRLTLDKAARTANIGTASTAIYVRNVKRRPRSFRIR